MIKKIKENFPRGKAGSFIKLGIWILFFGAFLALLPPNSPSQKQSGNGGETKELNKNMFDNIYNDNFEYQYEIAGEETVLITGRAFQNKRHFEYSINNEILEFYEHITLSLRDYDTFVQVSRSDYEIYYKYYLIWMDYHKLEYLLDRSKKVDTIENFDELIEDIYEIKETDLKTIYNFEKTTSTSNPYITIKVLHKDNIINAIIIDLEEYNGDKLALRFKNYSLVTDFNFIVE